MQYNRERGLCRSWVLPARIAFIVFFCSVSACSTSKYITYEVTSDPMNAPVEVNGVSQGSTPTELNLKCAKAWVGLANSSDGYASRSGAYEVVAFPPKGFNGESQKKNVNPCQWAGDGNPKLKFDLSLESVAPAQRMIIEQISNSPEKGTPSQLNRYEELRSLKVLFDEGVISEEEFEQEKQELLGN